MDFISESRGNKNSTLGHPDIIQKLGFRNDDHLIPSVTDDDVKACESDELDLLDDDIDEDEFKSDDDFDDHSSVNEISYEARKKSRWFKKIFESIDRMTVAHINDPQSKWHCPVCKGGPGEVYGKWDGIEVKDKEIMWPPMVIIMNTALEKDDNDKWIGMGNQELRDYFSSYAAVKAVKYSYRGMSVLVFEATPVGYMETACQ
ncbi:hypothetical protein K7X08_021325 [Anisodus acutangulus]|uniref:XS domain-containing protein n=1 Tax=Anisodus acutangulus TaxID=402998 RepID=A0A9Q1RAY7_9SOLA|nr:hypothetical protein K7X08_021325 [Anisodus acutangulus]